MRSYRIVPCSYRKYARGPAVRGNTMMGTNISDRYNRWDSSTELAQRVDRDKRPTPEGQVPKRRETRGGFQVASITLTDSERTSIDGR